MPSERVQRRIDNLLDQTEEAVESTEWARVRELAEAVLVADPENEDAATFLAMAQKAGEVDSDEPPDPPRGLVSPTHTPQYH
ncbi:MAG: hypothetical protein IIC79_03990 [Chloroflexi bacterium]|nr:hypothetical protein [Chloroflexota bacterium]